MDVDETFQRVLTQYGAQFHHLEELEPDQVQWAAMTFTDADAEAIRQASAQLCGSAMNHELCAQLNSLADRMQDLLRYTDQETI